MLALMVSSPIPSLLCINLTFSYITKVKNIMCPYIQSNSRFDHKKKNMKKQMRHPKSKSLLIQYWQLFLYVSTSRYFIHTYFLDWLPKSHVPTPLEATAYILQNIKPNPQYLYLNWTYTHKYVSPTYLIKHIITWINLTFYKQMSKF